MVQETMNNLLHFQELAYSLEGFIKGFILYASKSIPFNIVNQEGTYRTYFYPIIGFLKKLRPHLALIRLGEKPEYI